MANLLTGIRLFLMVPVAWTMVFPSALPALLVLLMIIIAILSDYFDGKVARATGTASANGMLFDHGTDFLFVTSALGGAAYAGLIPTILPILIVLAFSQYVLDSYFLFQQKQLRMSFLGRWNGVFYFVPIVMIAVSRLITDIQIAGTLLSLAWMLAIALVISTAASVVDRALAPLRSN